MPPNTTDPATIAATTAATEQATQAFNNATVAADLNSSALQNNANSQINLQTMMGKTVSGQTSQILASNGVKTAIDLVTQAYMGAGTAYNVFNTQMGQTSGFAAQTKNMFELIKGNDKLGLSLASIGKSLGFGVLSKAGDSIETFIMRTAAGADQAMNLQKGFVAMMGTSGGLDAFFRGAGTGLVNLNGMMNAQRDAITNLARSTSTSVEEITPLYKQMGTDLPSALGFGASAADKSKRSMEDLRKVTQLSSATGRDSKAVIDEMKFAWDNYGLSGQKALEFTSRMSELNSKFGINLEYTKKFIEDNATAFKRISTNADDGAKSFNRWFDALRGTGLSAKESSAMIGEMTQQMAKLSTAQKAFLSAQSGGPGGLRGAAKIEGLLKEGKEDEVLKMVESTLKKQFGGKITTLADAQKSEEAAGQYFKQKQMLQSGAFGGLAKDDASAARLLEAMKNGTSPLKALSADGALHTTLKQGDELQKTSNTLLSSLRNIAERQLAISSGTSLEAVQKLIGGRSNEKGIGVTPGLNQKVEDYRGQAGVKLSETASKIRAGESVNINEIRKENFDELAKFVPDSFKKTLASIKNKIFSDSKDTQAQGMSELHQAQSVMKQPAPASPLTYANMNERYTSRALATGTAVNQSVGTAKTPAWLEAYNPAGQAAAPGQTQQPGPPPPNTKVDVTVKGLCLKCARPMQSDPTTVAVKGGT